MLYVGADLFPSVSQFGGFTLFYQLFCSLSIIVFLIMRLVYFQDDSLVYKVLILFFIPPLALLSLSVQLLTENVYQKSMSFCHFLLAASIVSILRLLVSWFIHA